MADTISISALRSALQNTDSSPSSETESRFESMVRRYEESVQSLVREITSVVEQIPELSISLEDEVETFTSPAFPGRKKEVRDQRVRITCGDNWLLFDPAAKAFLHAMGHVEVEASRPIPFMVERLLYLIPGRNGAEGSWRYPAVANLGGPPVPFTQETLLKLLHCVFAGD